MIRDSIDVRFIKTGRATVFFFAVLIFAGAVTASVWRDPDYLTMIKKSDLIVRARVTEGGTFIARVQVLDKFFGDEKGKNLVVGGFNNPHWPARGREIESFKKGEEYVLFLNRPEGDFAKYLKSQGGEAGKKLLEPGPFYTVWTPTAGDVPLQEDRALTCLMDTGYSRRKHGLPYPTFARFLKAAISNLKGSSPGPEYIDERLKALDREPGKGEPPRHFHLMALQICGLRRFDPRLEKAAAFQESTDRFALAKVLREIGGGDGVRILETLAGDADAVVQGEAVRALVALGNKASAPKLLALLESAGEGGISPSSIMDPRRNTLHGGKVEIVRALGIFEYAPAEPKLKTLLKTKNRALFAVVLQTLLRLKSPAVADFFRASLRSGKRRNSLDILETIRKHKIPGLVRDIESFIHPRQNWLLKERAVTTLGAVGDGGSVTFLAGEIRRSVRDRFGLREKNARLPIRMRKSPDGHGYHEKILRALAELKGKEAEGAALEAFHLWSGLHPAMALNPAIFDGKREAEKEVLRNIQLNIPEGFTLDQAKAVAYYPVFLEDFEKSLETVPEKVAGLGDPVVIVKLSLKPPKGLERNWHMLDSIREELAGAVGLETGRVGLSIWNFVKSDDWDVTGAWYTVGSREEYTTGLLQGIVMSFAAFARAAGGDRSAAVLALMLEKNFPAVKYDSYSREAVEEALKALRGKKDAGKSK